ncbi:hypothetical protein P7C73_g4659, partial [Tremellales sp. Uapishka_1]
MSSLSPRTTALFLTHFDDIEGQSVVYYQSIPSLPAANIEHSTLPSGLHSLSSDYILFTHDDYPAIGLFTSSETASGRGRRMGTLGICLEKGREEELWGWKTWLEALWRRLDADGGLGSEGNRTVLDSVWETCRAEEAGGKQESSAEAVRRLVDGAEVEDTHPVSFMPPLLDLVGPSIIPLYKASLTGKRILLYAPPPLLPLAGYAWCIYAMGLAPASCSTASTSAWIGNIGLMDLDQVRTRTGGWVATTSDKIFKSQTKAYDLFIDFSLPQPVITSNTAGEIGYTFGDLPLYRTLSPEANLQGGYWLVAYNVYEKLWNLCVGVCEFAIGKGRIDGPIRLPLEDGQAEEGEPLLVDEGELGEGNEIRKGRMVLRQLHHNTFHLYRRLREVQGGAEGPPSDAQLRGLGRWWGKQEAFWRDLSVVWGVGG